MPTSKIEFLLSTRDQHDLFGDFLPDSSADDPTARWSHTNVWAQASGRMGEYGPDDWTDIAAEQHDWERRVVLLRASGEPADGPAAADLAEEQRRSIERWYFTCPPVLHRVTIDALLADPSFRTRYDALAPGTADFIRSAVHTNAARTE